MSAEQACLIYVVEDDDAVRASTRLLLETMGYAVRDYASGDAVLADPAATAADCFLMDYQLGGMTGLDLLERLRDRGIQTPVLLVTANANHSEERGRRAGVLAVLQKPVPVADLLAWIAKACSAR